MQIVNFVMAHKAPFMALGMAILDLVFALNPNSKANGILHWAYLALGGKE